MSFIIETRAKESYLVTFFYMVDANVSCVAEVESELIGQRFEVLSSQLIQADYTEENWNKLQNLVQEGRQAIKDSISLEHARMICSQYLLEFSKVEKVYKKLEGLTVIEISSVEENKNNIVDNRILRY